MIALLCGLSGAGKTTLAINIYSKLLERGINAEIIDGDEYRGRLFKDLKYSKEDRNENIRRLGFIANKFSSHGIIAIVSAINPYDEIRRELAETYPAVKLIHIDCPLETLIARDTKGLYRRSMLPADHPDKIFNLTGVNDRFDIPANPDLYISTDKYNIEECALLLLDFILQNTSLAKNIHKSVLNPLSINNL